MVLAHLIARTLLGRPFAGFLQANSATVRAFGLDNHASSNLCGHLGRQMKVCRLVIIKGRGQKQFWSNDEQLVLGTPRGQPN